MTCAAVSAQVLPVCAYVALVAVLDVDQPRNVYPVLDGLAVCGIVNAELYVSVELVVLPAVPPFLSYTSVNVCAVQPAVNVPAPAPNVNVLLDAVHVPVPPFVHPVNVYPVLAAGSAIVFVVP